MLPSVLSQKLLLPQCWPSYKDTFSPNSIDAQRIRSNLYFLNLYLKHSKKHTADFQKLVSRLGQIYSIICHIHLPSIYGRKWQIKLTHTRLNPGVHSFLLIQHCTVTIWNPTKTQIPSTQRNFAVTHCTSKFWKESSTQLMCWLFSHQYNNKNHTTALQCYTHSSLYYCTFLYCYTWGEVRMFRIFVSFFGFPHITLIFILHAWIWSSGRNYFM